MSRVTAFCMILLVFSGLGLVASQYRARQLFIDLETARGIERKLDVEWRTLQIEQTNFAKHSLIETAARRDLNMQRATAGRMHYIAVPQRAATGIEAPTSR